MLLYCHTKLVHLTKHYESINIQYKQTELYTCTLKRSTLTLYKYPFRYLDTHARCCFYFRYHFCVRSQGKRSKT